MLKTQRNKLYMYRAMRDLCNAHETSWTGVPAFVEAFTAFSEKVTLINDLARLQLTMTSGVKHQRETLLEEAVDITLQCSDALHSYGLKISDALLADSADISKSDILQAPLNRATLLIGYIAEKAAEHATVLEDYGITPVKSQLMMAKHEALLEEMNAPRQAITSRKTITSKISRLVKEVDILIQDHIDGLMNIIRSEAPDFHAEYLNARVIVENGKRHKASDEPSGGNAGEPDDEGGLF